MPSLSITCHRKYAVTAMLLHGVGMLSDAETLKEDTQHLKNNLQPNGYSNCDIRQALQHVKLKLKYKNKKPTA
jgi:uncharacterized protein Smg (DUF494 family)